MVKEEDDDCQYEGFQYVASQVWEEKTGKGMDEFPRNKLKYLKSPAGEEWTEEGDDLKAQIPEALEEVRGRMTPNDPPSQTEAFGDRGNQ